MIAGISQGSSLQITVFLTQTGLSYNRNLLSPVAKNLHRQKKFQIDFTRFLGLFLDNFSALSSLWIAFPLGLASLLDVWRLWPLLPTHFILRVQRARMPPFPSSHQWVWGSRWVGSGCSHAPVSHSFWQGNEMCWLL